MKLKTIQARIPEKLYEELEQRVELGMYASTSEVMRDALRKMFVEQSRTFLRDLAKEKGIKKEELLEELWKIRRAE
ncbi:MAG: ribbon-helix-helix protein, CopG family [Candidatus Aenigmarchaeota archaeon]|nr:ribbon-helix-helix protein, CopG family [Candidatus Aenigmarchaeota archaeon]